MADIPLNTGYSLERWRKGLNIMLEKSPGNFNVEKLRIILLFEADFNANNKWLGWAVMINAETFNLLAPEQNGSCKQKSAVSQCLNKLLFYDYIHFCKQPAALCSSDAKSCYNWIVLLIVALCLHRLGASHSGVSSMITTLTKWNTVSALCLVTLQKAETANSGVNQSPVLAKVMVLGRRFGRWLVRLYSNCYNNMVSLLTSSVQFRFTAEN